MILMSSDLQSDSDLDSIRNSCDVYYNIELSFGHLFPFLSFSVVSEFGHLKFLCQNQWNYLVSLNSCLDNLDVESSETRYLIAKSLQR